MPPPDGSFAADAAACRAILRAGSKSFSAAAPLLPRRIRVSTTVLYAFCRDADDAVDLSLTAGDATVDALHARLDRVYSGKPDASPIDRALAVIVQRERLPRTLLDALLEGMTWDARGRRYPSLEDLHAYAARVAGAVGAMLALVMGRRSRDMVARACDLGIAMQLTNVARDVGEDARRGRIYLPLTWLEEAGIDPERWLARPEHSDALASVVARLLEAADRLYVRADAGIDRLPADCRTAIRAARLIYADIGRSIARAGFDSVNRRAYVGKWRKVWLLGRALARRPGRGDDHTELELEPARFLVTACAESP